MKKIYFLFTFLISSLTFGQTFFTENMGTPASTTLINNYSGWQNGAPIVFSGDGDVRTSLVSTGYTGASGSGNVFLTSTAGKNLRIDGIDTSAYLMADIQLSFGYLTNSAATQIVLEQSTDGTNWTPITFTPNANTSWNLVTVADGQIFSSATLSLRFTQPATAQMRIDDVKLANVSSTCALSLSPATTTCNATTIALDDYTVNIPFTGGSTASYTITTTGTVSGDDPSSVAAGNIFVTFVEGTSYAVNISGGTCNIDITGNSPECKPTNSLPYYEGFDYAVGNALASEQKWTGANSGDDILTTAGSLSYTGLTPTGNSVSFAGTGLDCFSPITDTNSGTLYYSLLLNVNTLAGATAANGGYLAGFGSNLTTFGGTLWTKRIDDNSYNLGIEVRTAPAGTTFDTTTLEAGQTYFVVVAYRFNGDASDDTVDLWINPVVGDVEPAATITDTHEGTDLSNIANFFLRQDTATSTPSILLDELRIGATWTDVTTNTLSTGDFNVNNFKVYPNPTSTGFVNITSTNADAMSVAVFDVLGKQVINETVSNNRLDVSSLNAGLYIVKISQNNATTTKKLVIK